MLDRLRHELRVKPWLFAATLSAVLLVINVIAEPDFGKPSNYPSQLATLAPLALVAMASMPSIVSGGGGLDLSVGPIAVFVNVLLTAQLLAHDIGSIWVDIPILLLAGTAIGAVNGILVTRVRYVPVIATLCTFFILFGVNLNLGANVDPAPANWTTDFRGMIGPIPGALILMGIPVLIWWLLSRTSYLRALYAVGGNEVTAFASGINVERTRIVAYALGGLFAAFGGIALTVIVQSSQSGQTGYYILVGVAAVALGGLSLGGGRGGITCAIFGALVLYLLQSMLSALAVSNEWLNVVYGAMLIIGTLVGATAGTSPLYRKASTS